MISQLYGLIGKPLQHSFSKKFFDAFFEKNAITNAAYENFELENIEECTTLMQKENLSGFNVTIPYKKAIIPFLSDIDQAAIEIQAINCVKRNLNGWTGYNTDHLGFERSLGPLLFSRHKKALVFGTGGASLAVQFVLKKKGIEFDLVSNSGVPGSLKYSDIGEKEIHKALVLVNCTPLGSYPDVNNSINIPYHAIGKKHLLFDMVYNPAKSDFLKSGELMGATIKNGYEMLEIQALESWRIWQEKV